jgi:Ca2+-transporting ATPase
VGIALKVIREPMFAMLVAGAALYLALGETGDGLLLLAAVVMVISLTLYHERRTDRALEALAELSSPRARVIRDGTEQRIPGNAVVVGDIVIVTEGIVCLPMPCCGGPRIWPWMNRC